MAMEISFEFSHPYISFDFLNIEEEAQRPYIEFTFQKPHITFSFTSPEGTGHIAKCLRTVFTFQ